MTKTTTQYLGSWADSGTHNTSWDVLGDFTKTARLLPISAIGIGVVAAFVALPLTSGSDRPQHVAQGWCPLYLLGLTVPYFHIFGLGGGPRNDF